MPRLPPKDSSLPYTGELKDSNKYYRVFLHEDVSDGTEEGIWFFDWIEQQAFWGSNWDQRGVGNLDGVFTNWPTPDAMTIRRLPEVPAAVSGIPPLIACFDQRFNRDRLLPSGGMKGITDYNHPSVFGIYDFSEKDSRYGPGMFLERDFSGSVKKIVPQWFPGQDPYNGPPWDNQNGQDTENDFGTHLNFFKTVTPVSKAKYNYRGDFAAMMVFKLSAIGEEHGLFSYEAYSDDAVDTGDVTRHYALWVNSDGYFEYGHSWRNGPTTGTPFSIQEDTSTGATPLIAGKTYYLLFIRKHSEDGQRNYRTNQKTSDHRFIIYLFEEYQIRQMSIEGRLAKRVGGFLADPAWKPRSVTDYGTGPNGNGKITNNTAWQSPNADDIVNSPDQNIESDRTGLYVGFAHNDAYMRGYVKHFRLFAGPQIYWTDAQRKEVFGPTRLEETPRFEPGPIPDYFDMMSDEEGNIIDVTRFPALEEVLLAAIRPKIGKDSLWYPVPQLASLKWNKTYNGLGGFECSVSTSKLLKYVGKGADLSGLGPPGTGLGNIGDTYLDTTNNVFYFKTAFPVPNGTWTEVEYQHVLGPGVIKLTDLFSVGRPFRIVARDEPDPAEFIGPLAPWLEPDGANPAEDATVILEGLTNSSDYSDKDRVARCSDGPNVGASSILRQASVNSIPALFSVTGRDMAGVLHNREMKSVIVNDGDNSFDRDNGITQETMRIPRPAWQILFIMASGALNRDLAKMPAITAIAPRYVGDDEFKNKRMPYENFGDSVPDDQTRPYGVFMTGTTDKALRVYTGGTLKMNSDDLFTFACDVAQVGHIFSNAKIDGSAGSIMVSQATDYWLNPNTPTPSGGLLQTPLLNFSNQSGGNGDHDQEFLERTEKPWAEWALRTGSDPAGQDATGKVVYTGFPDRIDVVSDPFFRPWIRYIRYDDTRFLNRVRSSLLQDPEVQPNGKPGFIPRVIHERQEASNLNSSAENNRVVNELTLRHTFADEDDTAFGSSNEVDIDIIRADVYSQGFFGQHSATIQAPWIVTADEPNSPNYFTAIKFYNNVMNMYAGLWQGGNPVAFNPDGSRNDALAGIRSTNASLRNGALCAGGLVGSSVTGFTAQLGDLMEIRTADFYNVRLPAFGGPSQAFWTSNTVTIPGGDLVNDGVRPGMVISLNNGEFVTTILSVINANQLSIRTVPSSGSLAPFTIYDPKTSYNDILLGIMYGMASEQLSLNLGLPKMDFKEVQDRRSSRLANTIGR